MALVLLLLGVILPTPLLAQSRDSEPLVVTGEQVVIAQNTNRDILASQSVCQVDLPVSPNLLVGFRREEGSWVQVPVQVKSSFFTWPVYKLANLSIFATTGLCL